MQRKLTDVGQQPLVGDMPAFLRIESIPYNAARYQVVTIGEVVAELTVISEPPPLEWAGFTLMESARPSLWLKLKNFCISLWRRLRR